MTGTRQAAALLLGLWAWIMVAAGGCAGARTFEELAAQPYDARPLPTGARVFLIAGGVDVANFAQEVITQRAYWRAVGVPPEAIVCYYAKPTRAAYVGDRDQYRALSRALEDCYPARTALIHEHLVEASRARPPFLYVYVSTHGRETLFRAGERGPELGLSELEVALLDQYFLQMGADPGRGIDAREVIRARRLGAPVSHVLLSPHSLTEAVASFEPDIPKIVILQGCHTGGFLAGAAGEEGLRADRLTRIPNLTVIAAARHDRTSFGCDPGARMTYFGSVFHHLLFEHDGAQEPTTIPWESLYEQLVVEVERIEATKDVRPSLPVFYTNAGGVERVVTAGTEACDAPRGCE